VGWNYNPDGYEQQHISPRAVGPPLTAHLAFFVGELPSSWHDIPIALRTTLQRREAEKQSDKETGNHSVRPYLLGRYPTINVDCMPEQSSTGDGDDKEHYSVPESLVEGFYHGVISMHPAFTFEYECGKSLLHDCKACSLCNYFDATRQHSRSARWTICRSGSVPAPHLIDPPAWRRIKQ